MNPTTRRPFSHGAIFLFLLLGRVAAADTLPALSKQSEQLIATVKTESTFGAGIVIGWRGSLVYLATARHVVEMSPSSVEVGLQFLPGESFSATVMETIDRQVDVAVLKVILDQEILPPGDLADFLVLEQLGPEAELVRGSPVIPVGHPAGRSWFFPTEPAVVHTLTFEAIEFEPACDVGYSGGGLFDRDSRLVGMIVSSDGVVCRALKWPRIEDLLYRWRYPVDLRIADVESLAETPSAAPRQTALLLDKAIANLTGLQGQINIDEARKLFIAAEQADEPLSRMWLARCYHLGRAGFQKDTEFAERLAKQRCSEGGATIRRDEQPRRSVSSWSSVPRWLGSQTEL